MFRSRYLASRYLLHHWPRTTILISSVALILYLPAATRLLVNDASQQIRNRAFDTPLVIGARGSAEQLALNALYFTPDCPERIPFSVAQSADATSLATMIPLHACFRVGEHPLVGTSSDYFAFRKMKVRQGHWPGRMGDCVAGAAVARKLQLEPGSQVVCAAETLFDLTVAVPLRMRVTGILAETNSPDDDALLTGMETVWIIEGLGHGHRPDDSAAANDRQLRDQNGHESAHAAAAQYLQITDDNVQTFHFHGHRSEFPITAVIAVPLDARSAALLRARHEATSRETQIIVPIEAVESLLKNLVRIRGLIEAATLLLGAATLLAIGMVLLLSLRLREREFSTLRKLGGPKHLIAQLIGWEIGLILVCGVMLACGFVVLTHWFSASVMRAMITLAS